MNDPIVDEVRRIRDAHAAKFNYDLDAIFQDIKEQEKKSGLKFVSYPPRRTELPHELQSAGAARADSQAASPAVAASTPEEGKR
jgi:hypothetical protein